MTAAACKPDIQDSKRLFARVATERVPLVRTIQSAPARADDGALKEGFFPTPTRSPGTSTQ